MLLLLTLLLVLGKEYTGCETILETCLLLLCEGQEHPLELIRGATRDLRVHEHFCLVKFPELQGILKVGRLATSDGCHR